jgi:hypothetical protein
MKQKVLVVLFSVVFVSLFSIGFAQGKNRGVKQIICRLSSFLLTGDLGYAPNKEMDDFSKAMAESVAEQYNYLAAAISVRSDSP